MANVIPYGAVCPWPRIPPKKHRNRVLVCVRSFVDASRILRRVTESEARIMCGENADGSEMLGQDGKPIEAVARRLSRRKAALTDIQLLAPVKSEKRGAASLSSSDTESNAFNQAFKALGDTDSIRQLERATAKYQAWPEVHDDRNVIVCAGKVHGVVHVAAGKLASL
jgi:hypothetical protein